MAGGEAWGLERVNRQQDFSRWFAALGAAGVGGMLNVEADISNGTGITAEPNRFLAQARLQAATLATETAPPRP